jgi:hypothetical protein
MRTVTTLLAGVGLIALAACSPNRDAGAGSGEGHHHEPPHGGTGVVLGDEEYHLEFVLNAAAGKMQTYVLSAHMENFVRISAESFAVTAKLRDREETLTFKPVANSATGETVGDTSMFETQADWLKANKTFDAVLKEITIKGKTYENVAFNFPKGN